ncbi:Kynurenine formamidase [Orchesella cincta]|uniref:Kynurenine formamidase n=1 Tax=Orchesella cincta TaxID=48709 RepID=A0A1D2N5U1_ORCCI|nr:Kynurenine formamidase [Orchesella cincta]
MQDVSGFNHTDAGVPYWLAMFSFCMGEHGGTHVDAPYHFNPLGWKLSEIPVERLTDVPAAV